MRMPSSRDTYLARKMQGRLHRPGVSWLYMVHLNLQPGFIRPREAPTVRSSTSIDEFFSFFELEPDDEIGSTTVNGWLTEHFENIPRLGDSFVYENLTVTVLSADETMTHEIKVEVTPPPAEEDEQEDEETETEKTED